jgi:threonylcarbamoyladenosine tRNA methylthiotransferase MtaB
MNVAIQTLGCKVNFAEMAHLADRLSSAGFTVAESHPDPDVVVINSCTVTAQADRKVRTLVHGVRRRHPRAHLVLTGCHVDNPGPRISAIPDVDIAFPNARKHEIADYLLAAFPVGPAGGTSSFTRARYFLKAQDGCNHRCTYCIVWQTRGASRSLVQDTLLVEAREAVARGYREIVLTGVDLGAYGREHGGSLAQLAGRMLDAIAPARLRLSSVNANDFTPELVELVAAPRFCQHLHIPLQSGSDRVLKRMGRLYRQGQYLELVASLRTTTPDLAVTTDVIVGFPGESDEDFQQTQEVARAAAFSGMHVFRYSPRARTAAPRLGPPADDTASQARSHQLQAQADRQRLAYEGRFIGRPTTVIWDRRFGQRIRGLTDTYVTVFAPFAEQRIGALATVVPTGATFDGLLVS